jgi:ribosomal protein S18 acetylase RimI-like enzyme
MPLITIRPFEAKDIAHFAVMIADTPLWQRYGMTPEKAADRLIAALQSDAVLLVADDSTAWQGVGLVWLVLRGAFDNSGYVRQIIVSPRHRGQGIGQLHLQAAEDRTRQSSRDLILLCSDFNTDAQRWYERSGYVRVGAIPDYVLDGVTELIYRKRL